MTFESAPVQFSVVVAVRDAVATIERCLQSVEDQQEVHVELLVVDGGSTDGTLAVLDRHAKGMTWWMSRPDGGIAEAWNRALERAGGRWVLFLGADDYLWSSRALASALPHLDALDPQLCVAYGRVHVVDAEGRVVRSVGAPWEESRAEIRRRMAIPHQATFHRRELFDRVGRFDTSYRICSDYELLLRELMDGDAHFLADCVVAAMQSGGLSDRPGSGFVMTREFLRAQYRHGVRRTPGWLAPRYWRALLRWQVERRFGSGAARSLSRLWQRWAGRNPR